MSCPSQPKGPNRKAVLVVQTHAPFVWSHFPSNGRSVTCLLVPLQQRHRRLSCLSVVLHLLVERGIRRPTSSSPFAFFVLPWPRDLPVK